MSENKEIQKMYEYQEKKGNSGYEYVVRGAEVFCGYGSKTCALELPKDHGVYTSDGRPLITVNDSKIKNIRGFGTCNINRRKPCTCEPKLGTWSVVSNKDMKIKDNNTKKEAFAVERNSTAICLKGGIIAFSTSGQASPSFNQLKVKEAVEIVENVKGRWNNTDYNKDFLGNIKINNAGLYNFGISFYNNKTVNKPGSIFVYENGGGKYKFIGAYEIKDHTGNEQNKFPEDTIRADSSNQSMYTYSTYYWKYWADIVLKAGKEYYFEIDCPSREAFDYMLIGNQEKEMLRGDNTGGIWILNSEFKTMNPYVYGQFKLSKYYDNGIGSPVVIMYLAPVYNWVIRDFISIRIAQNSNTVGNVSNVLSVVSAVCTGATYIQAFSVEAIAVFGHVSAVLTGITLLLALMPKPVLEKIKDEMYKNPDDCLKITLYDFSDGEQIEYGGYDITGCKVEVCSGYNGDTYMIIDGEKYLIGNFHMLEPLKIDFKELHDIKSKIGDAFKKIDDNFK